KRDPTSDKTTRLEATNQSNIKCKEEKEAVKRGHHGSGHMSELPLVPAFPFRTVLSI
ncbi:hypothetical protein QBC32DRAFT_177232, partial [Pseudoneurospora amorphoporcata]